MTCAGWLVLLLITPVIGVTVFVVALIIMAIIMDGRGR